MSRSFTCLAVLVVAPAVFGWQDLFLDNSQVIEEKCTCGWTNRGRIIGGKETGVNEYPMIAGIQKKNGFQFCGGTVITPWHVLTAAHCTEGFNATDIQVNLGDHNIYLRTETKNTVIPVAQIIDHENYQKKPLKHDISILVTAEKIKFSKTIGPACVPNRRIYLGNEKLKVLGWGDLVYKGSGSARLQEVDLKVIPFYECKKVWPNAEEATMFCTFEQGKDACQGDSGGPLLWLDHRTNRLTIVGVVSYGSGCGGPKPGVNTEVGAYLDWVNKKIEESKPGYHTCRNI